MYWWDSHRATLHKEIYDQICQKQLNNYGWRQIDVLREKKTLTKGNTAKYLSVGIVRNPERELMGEWSFWLQQMNRCSNKGEKAKKLQKRREWQVIIGQMEKKVRSNKGRNLWSLRAWYAVLLEAFMSHTGKTLPEDKELLVMELVFSGKIKIERWIMDINSVMSYCAWDRQDESGWSSRTCYYTMFHSSRALQEKKIQNTLIFMAFGKTEKSSNVCFIHANVFIKPCVLWAIMLKTWQRNLLCAFTIRVRQNTTG